MLFIAIFAVSLWGIADGFVTLGEFVAFAWHYAEHNVPVLWEYRRKDLPVKVIARHENWRRVEDPDGTRGWMAARLLSRTRTAIVTGAVRPLREEPSLSAAIAYRAEPGVVGRITDCKDGWCRFDVKGRKGWIQTDHIWGD